MFPDMRQNSTFNSTNNLGTDYVTRCNDMSEGPVIWTCVSSVCVLFGFPACVAVFWELLQRHRRGIPTTPNDVFMLNLTVMDSVYLGFNPLGICNYWFWYNRPIIQLFYFIYTFTLVGRPLFMTCICLDCYLAVVHPITYRARKSLTPRVLMSIGVWAVTLVYGILHALFTERMIDHPVNVLPHVVTISTIGICDFFILRALRSSDPGGRDLHPQKKKALQIIINSLVMTLIAYLPPMLYLSFHKLMPMSAAEIQCQVLLPITLCTIAGSTIMPVLYLGNLGKLDRILPCRSA